MQRVLSGKCLTVLLLSIATACVHGPLVSDEGDAEHRAVPRTATFPEPESSPLAYAPAEEVGLSGEALERIGDEVETWVADGDVMGAEILVIRNDRAGFHEAIGWSDLEEGRPLQRNSIYRIRSMTKPLVGTSILILMEEGRLQLDDPAATYLASFDNERSRAITIRSLLSHTSGLGNSGSEDVGLPRRPDEYESLRELVDDLGAIGASRPPGAFHYSDAGSATLGAIVEEVSGMPVERFIETRILEPLGMTDTHTRFEPDAHWVSRMNSTYRWSRDDCGLVRYWDPTMKQRYRYFRASGGLYSSIADYARFLSMWMNRGRYGDMRLLSEATVEEALRPVARGDGRDYAMHWTIRDDEMIDGLPAMFGHGGSDGTMAFAWPALDSMVLYFTQSRGHNRRENFLELLANLEPFAAHTRSRLNLDVLEAWKQSEDQRREPVALSPDQLARLTGSFSGWGETHEVFQLDGGLRYRLEGEEAIPMRPLSPLRFVSRDDCRDHFFLITFLPEEDGRIDRYQILDRGGLKGMFERVR